MKRKKRRDSDIPLSWKICQAVGCFFSGSLLFAAIYEKFYVELQASVGSAPDPVERYFFSGGFAVFFTILMAYWSGVILRRIFRRQSMADIAGDIAQEAAAEALGAIVDGVVGGASGGAVKGSSGTKGGGGSSGGGGASGGYL